VCDQVRWCEWTAPFLHCKNVANVSTCNIFSPPPKKAFLGGGLVLTSGCFLSWAVLVRCVDRTMDNDLLDCGRMERAR
jgi:hypothetical protein